MQSEPSPQESIDEQARRCFEAAWRDGASASIEEHLPPTEDPRYLATLEELVHIDLEMGWKSRSGRTPRVEEYVQRFPPLAEPSILLRLLRQEYSVRHRFGDQPSTAEYLSRFPTIKTLQFPVETRAAPRPEAAGVPHIPGYELLQRIGRGGMGTVYLARQVGLDRLVAIKLLRAGEATDEEVARFRTEAEAIARLRHPNVVQVYEVGTAEGRPFLALEYVPGGSLDRAIAGVPQAPIAAAAVLEPLARGVQAAHAAGILHRDLKPANVLLDQDDTDQSATQTHPPLRGTGSTSVSVLEATSVRPKVTDFGLAKRLDADRGQTLSGAVLGTPSYMAPEQAAGRGDVGPAADVYGLGAILYELLTGRPPFRAATAIDTLTLVVHDDPVPPARLQPTVPRDLETICLKCLSKSPTQRYATVAELADDLQRFLAGKPVLARPVGRLERTIRWARRHPTSAGLLAASAVAVLALVGVSVALYFNGRLQTALGQAEERRDEAQTARQSADAQRSIANQLRQLAEANETEAQRQRKLARRYQFLAHMRLAHQAVQDDDVPHALALLDRYRTHDTSGDSNSVEWRLVRRFTRNLHALRGHTEDAVDVVFSPNGRRVASAGWDHTVRFWDSVAGKSLNILELKPTEPMQRIGGIAFDSKGDRFAVSFGKFVGVFDAATGKKLAEMSGHADHVGGVAFSPDDSKLATASSDGTAAVWDVATGKRLFLLAGDKDEMLRRIAFSQNGAHLAWASSRMNDARTAVTGGGVKVWELASRKPIIERRWDGSSAEDVAFDPAGKRLAVADADGGVRVIELASDKQLLQFTAHEKGANAVRFSPDGTRLATAGYDLAVRLWNAADGTPLLTLRGHSGRGTIIQARGLPGINRVAFSPDGARLASVGDDRAVMIWDIAAPPNPLPPEPPPDPKNGLFSPDGSRLAVWERPAVVLRDANGKLLHTLKAPSDQARNMTFSDDGTRLLVEYGRPMRDVVTVWDVATGRDLLTAHPGPGDKLLQDEHGRWLIAATTKARIWDVNTGRETITAGEHAAPIALAVVSSDGRFLATAGSDELGGRSWAYADGDVKVWDMSNGQLVWNLRGHTWRVREIAWRPDGKSLASASLDGTIRIWDMANGAPGPVLTGHRSGVNAVAFSLDGDCIASGGVDKTVRLWDPMTGEEVLTLNGHAEAVWSVAFGPGADCLISRSGPRRGGTRKVWDARRVDR